MGKDSGTPPNGRDGGTPIVGDSDDNLLAGTSGGDYIRGLGGDDTLTGGAGDDRLRGGHGDDTLDGGSGSDLVNGGKGDDLLVFTLSENAGETNLYDGGKGTDTLRLNLTLAEFDALRAELVALQAFIAETADPSRSTGQSFVNQSANSANHPIFETSFGLTVRNVEALEIFVDGSGPIDPADPVNSPPVITGPVTAATHEDAPPPFDVDLMAGASDPDIGDTLSVANLTQTGGPAAAFTVVGATLSLDQGQFNSLAVGESAVLTFSYDVSDSAATVAQTATVTVEGRNDAPVLSAAVTANTNEDAPAPFDVDLLAGVSDPDTSDTLSVVNFTQTTVGPDAVVSVVGTTLSLDPGQFNSLAVGESAVLTFTYDVFDGTATVAQTATVTVEGRNDAPVLSAAVIETTNEDAPAPFEVDLLAGASDADASDTLSVVNFTQTTVGPDAVVSVVGTTLSLDPGQFNSLAVGESAVLTFSYDVFDGTAIVAQTATVTVQGGNDAPVLSAAVTANTNEDAPAPFDVDLLAGASDADTSDTLSVVNFTQTTVGPDAVVSVVGTTLSLDPGQFNSLAVGESAALTFTYDVFDGTATVAQTATVTVEGRNDAPVLSAAVIETTNEDAPAPFDVDLLAGASDPDTSDTLSVVNFIQTTVGPDAVVSVVGTTLSLDPGQFNNLAAGESAVLIFSYDVFDGTVAVAQTATVTVDGRNDAPVLSAAVTANTNEDAPAPFDVDLLAGASDPDTSDVLGVNGVTQTGGPTAVVSVAGTTLSLDPSQFGGLAVGESAVLTFSYNVSDGTIDVPQTLTLTVEGRDDTIVLSGAVVAGTNEDAPAPFEVDLLSGASDPDTSAVLGVNSVTQTAGPPAVFAVNGTILSIEPNQFNALALGESAELTFSYFVTDGTINLPQTLTLTVEGRNDSPTAIVLSDQTLLGDTNGAAVGTLTAIDPDVNDGHTFTVSDARFEIVGDQLKLKDGSAIDFDAEPVVSISVTATDPGGLAVVESFDITARFPGVINLAGIVASDGFRLTGEAAGDVAGISVSSAGDIDGDGFDDFIVGAERNDGGVGTFAGSSYVVLGGQTLSGSVSLGTVGTSVQGFRVTGEAAFNHSGYSVSSAGDVDGDGIDDMVFGAYTNGAGGPNAGAAYVVFGGQSLSGSISSSSVVSGAVQGFRLTGEARSDFAGWSVSQAGDVNGDGVGDLIVSAVVNDAGANNAGAAYVVFGGQGLSGSVSLSAVGTTVQGFRLTGEAANDFSGRSVSAAGDVNNDGFGDLVIGGENVGGSGIGAAYVVLGGQGLSGSVSLTDVGTTVQGFQLNGVVAGDQAGRSVSSAGDVNGDGFDDVIVGALGSDLGSLNAGAAYVIFGGQGLTGDSSLAGVGTTIGGFRLTGETTGDLAGRSVSSAGDVNGDGFGDVVIGANGEDSGGANAGTSYVVFGGQGLTGSITTSDIGGSVAGIRIIGAEVGEGSGGSVSSAGDIDGDGFDDLIIGAKSNDVVDTDAGAAYVVYGKDFSGVVTHEGTSGSDALVGGAGDDVMLGGRGDDTLAGDGGADRLTGGRGDDVLTGGGDDDLFVFADGDGADVINDFVAGAGSDDVVNLFGVSGIAEFADVIAAASQVGSDTLIDFGGGDSIKILGVNVGALDADDFLA